MADRRARRAAAPDRGGRPPRYAARPRLDRHRRRGWLDYWRDDVGLPGFYPFDLLAGAYVLAPERFDCADAEASIRRDLRLWGRLWGPWAVLVRPKGSRAAGAGVRGPVVYCERVDAERYGWLIAALTGP